MTGLFLVATGPLVAVIDAKEQAHAWAKSALGGIRFPLITCEAVIAETWFLLGRTRTGRRSLVGLLAEGQLLTPVGLASEGRRIAELMKKYADHPMSRADASLVRMAELEPSARIVTLDRDFLVYRRGRQPLGLVAPFDPT